ncbi:MAG: hypothetical protein M1814_006119 [Vezdaea aestivalis]|nr:MAG: hypothetical protein M1814_006119 [Vezdaea aestivalis]
MPSQYPDYGPNLADWVRMVNSDFTVGNLEEYINMSEHTTELLNAQALETPQLSANCTTLSFSVPVSVDQTSVKQPGNYETWTTRLQCRLYSPLAVENVGTGPFPLIVWLRSGLVCGDLETEDATCRTMCALASCAVLNIGYRKAPEHPWPVPLEDTWDVLVWAAQYGAEYLNVDLINRGFILGGVSTGAMLTASLAIRARDKRLSPPLTGLIMRSPITIHPNIRSHSLPTPPPEESNRYMFYGSSVHDELFERYSVPREEQASALASPVLVPSVAGLPPTYIQLPMVSASYQEGRLFANRLLKEGKIAVKVDEYEGQIHNFWDLPRLKGAADATHDLIMGIRWLESETGALGWDSGIREEAVQNWLLKAKEGEGQEAWRKHKLCRRAGCTCAF